MQGMVLLAESILGSIGELHAGSSPVQDTTIETRLRFLERVSEVFYLHYSERFKRAARFFNRCLEQALPIEKEWLVVACLSEAVLLIRQTAKQPGR